MKLYNVAKSLILEIASIDSIVDAINKGSFSIWAISHVTEAYALLTQQRDNTLKIEQTGHKVDANNAVFDLAQIQVKTMLDNYYKDLY